MAGYMSYFKFDAGAWKQRTGLGAKSEGKTSEDVASDTEAFLKQGGKIEQIPQGVSAMVNGKPNTRHITYSKTTHHRRPKS